MRILLKVMRVFIIAGFIFLNNAFAQNDITHLSLIKGNSFEKVGAKVSYLDGLDDAGNSYLVMAEGRNETEHYVSQINSSMNLTNSKKIDLEAIVKKINF
jgi:hypothetical protein